MKNSILKQKPAQTPSMRGGTLIELSLTMALIGLFAVGLLSGLQESPATARTASYKVAHDIRYAQNLAMVTGVNHGFKTLNSTQYEIYRQTPGNPVQDPSTFSPMQIDLSAAYRDAAFVADYRIEFNAIGQPVLGGGASLSISSGSVVKSFSVAGNTGLLNFL